MASYPYRGDDRESGGEHAMPAESASEAYEPFIRHAAHYLPIAKDASHLCEKNEGLEPRAGLELFALEWPNLLRGWKWAAEHLPESETAIQLCLDYMYQTAVLINQAAAPPSAIPLIEAAIAAAEMVRHVNRKWLAMTLLGTAYMYEGMYAEAEVPYRGALAVCESSFAPEHPRTAISLDNLAELLLKQGRNEEAKPLCLHALSLRETVLGPHRNQSQQHG